MEHIAQHQYDEPLVTENRVTVNGVCFDLQFPIDGQPRDTESLGSEPSIHEVPPWWPDDEKEYEKNPWNEDNTE